MRKAAILLLVFSLAGLVPLLAQETTTANPPQKDIAPMLTVQTGFTYNPEGRRDPFKDLLGGRDIKEKAALGEIEVSIDDLTLSGISKYRGAYHALFSMPQGFSIDATVGYKFADGYVLSINETQVVLRKTHERGIPLMRPRDVIKEITEEL
jgi:hypothetical protein